MEWNIWIQGLVLGFSIAAPVGPIGVLCIRRTLADGRLHGFVSGLGAATADACYGWIAAAGLSLISAFLVNLQQGFRLFGGVFLIYLGIRTLCSRPSENPAAVKGERRGLLGAYLSTFLLTLSNPATILSFIAIFAGMGIASQAGGDLWMGISLVAGVFCGSALWWLTLSGLVGIFRSRLPTGAMLWVNRLSGLCIIGFGLFAILSLRFSTSV